MCEEQIAQEVVQPTVQVVTVKDIEIEAQKESKVLGTVKFIYYLSPLGWLFSNKQHKLTLELIKYYMENE